MKKLLLASLSFATLAATAQTNHPVKKAGKESVKIATELGLNISNYKITDGPTTENTTSRVGLKLGGFFDIALSKNVYLQPGLYYAKNGYSLSEDDGSGNAMKEVVKVNTINIPVNVAYKFGRAGDNRFFAGAGLYLAYNMGGKVTETATDGSGASETTTVDLKVGSTSADYIKSMDIGFDLIAGYQLKKGFCFKLAYQHGFTNLAPVTTDNSSVISHGFSITAAYLFDIKKKSTGK